MFDLIVIGAGPAGLSAAIYVCGAVFPPSCSTRAFTAVR